MPDSDEKLPDGTRRNTQIKRIDKGTKDWPLVRAGQLLWGYASFWATAGVNDG